MLATPGPRRAPDRPAAGPARHPGGRRRRGQAPQEHPPGHLRLRQGRRGLFPARRPGDHLPGRPPSRCRSSTSRSPTRTITRSSPPTSSPTPSRGWSAPARASAPAPTTTPTASRSCSPRRTSTRRSSRARPSPPAPKGPAYSRSGASYRWDFDPYMDIFKADPDGSNLVRLTDTPGYDAEGSYSPDGKQIVFTSFRDGDAEIYIMDADGKNVRADHHVQGLRRRPVLLARRQADHLPERPQGERPAPGLHQQHRGDRRAGPDRQRVRQLGPVLPPRQPPHHLRHQPPRARELRALPDGRRHRRRGADHLPRGVRRPARLLARRQEADVDLQRPDRRQEEPALHRRLRAGPAAAAAR